MVRPERRCDGPALEIADVFRAHGPAYTRAHEGRLGRVEKRVMREITAEETEQMREASSDEFTAFEPGREVEVILQ